MNPAVAEAFLVLLGTIALLRRGASGRGRAMLDRR